MASQSAKTPLYDWHAAHGGRMTPFAGWSMPVQYTSIVAEHVATRTAATLFDVSHMGRIRFTGPGAEPFLDQLLTRRVTDMRPGQVRYSLITNERGGVLDDVLLYRLASVDRDADYVLVVNASNRQKILDWISSRRPASPQFEYADYTTTWAMIAVQGPQARQLLQLLTDIDLAGLKYYHSMQGHCGGHAGLISRTGYTGEDGYELMIESAAVVGIWDALLTSGGPLGVLPAGLGCRDTLRLEAGMPLYGHELTEEITPLQAGLDFAVNLEGRSFPGHDALVEAKNRPPAMVRVGLEMSGKRVPREGYAVLLDKRPIGIVSSGTFSPTLQRPIAMAYVPPAAAQIGKRLVVDIRGQAEPATVAPLPFYRRSA